MTWADVTSLEPDWLVSQGWNVLGLRELVACDRQCTSKMDLTEAEDIKKRWQEYTEELYKKDLIDPDNHDVIIHLEPGIQACKLKWALGSITMNKPSAGDGIPVELES